MPRLPEDVQRLGLQVRKATPNILLAVHVYSPNSSRDSLYLSNYTTLHIKDILARLQLEQRLVVSGVTPKLARRVPTQIFAEPLKLVLPFHPITHSSQRQA